MARRRTSSSALHAWSPGDDELSYIMTFVCHISRTPPSLADSEFSDNSDGAKLTAATAVENKAIQASK